MPDMRVVHGDFIAALKKRHWSEPSAFETCVLDAETSVRSSGEDRLSWEELRVELPGLARDTYDSYRSENKGARPISPTDRGAMKLHVLTKAEDAELEAILSDRNRMHEYWNAFRARYGNAVRVSLSVPGLSKDGKHALIYYAAYFDWLAAWGSYCLLKREGDRWEIAEEHCVWVS